MKVFIDTGAFYSIANKKDQWHKKTSNALKHLFNNKAMFYTSNFILSETYTLLRFRMDHPRAVKFIDEYQGSGIKNLRVSQIIEMTAMQIFKQYKDKTFSFVDCTSFALIDTHSFDYAFP